MPLPAALAARLQKRGLISNTTNAKSPSTPTTIKTAADEEIEEVFAEDYDEPGNETDGLPVEVAMETQPPEEEPVDDNHQHIREVAACPNRVNPYHECTDFCQKQWGMKEWTPSTDMIRKRDRMLSRYPLPPEWEEVADPETNRYYYWNTITEQVSWLSPSHPRANITISEEKLQAVLRDDKVESESEESEEDMDVTDSESSSSSSSSDEEDYDRRHDKGRLARERGGGRGGMARGQGRQQRSRRDDFDPMDPASYSDVARGGWSSGLERGGEAKTGVDTTASGPLFQQRPYPSPGAVLRANKAAGKPP